MAVVDVGATFIAICRLVGGSVKVYETRGFARFKGALIAEKHLCLQGATGCFSHRNRGQNH